MTAVKVATTEQFLKLARQADKDQRNRRVKVEELEKVLDPEGTHLVTFSMIHNDREVRAGWLLKQKDTMTPIEVYLDMSFDDYNGLPEVEVAEQQ